MTTDASGVKVSEIRYKAWGEIRATWIASPSATPAYRSPAYTFTGQFSYMDDPTTSGTTEGFGLMFYNARWYDPSLGRMAQADTVVPGGVQGLDRYAYVNNSPLNYVDPSGHFGQCHDGQSGYECGITQRKVSILEGQWAKVANEIAADARTAAVADASCRNLLCDSGENSKDESRENIKRNLRRQEIGQQDETACPVESLFCKEVVLTSAELYALAGQIANFAGWYKYAAAGFAIGAALSALSILIGTGPFGMVATAIFSIAAAGFYLESSTLPDLSTFLYGLGAAADKNGGSIKVAYYQGQNSFVPGINYEHNSEGQAYGFDTFTGWVLVKNAWKIP